MILWYVYGKLIWDRILPYWSDSLTLTGVSSTLSVLILKVCLKLYSNWRLVTWGIFKNFCFTRIIIISAWEGLCVLDKIKYVCATVQDDWRNPRASQNLLGSTWCKGYRKYGAWVKINQSDSPNILSSTHCSATDELYELLNYITVLCLSVFICEKRIINVAAS